MKTPYAIALAALIAGAALVWHAAPDFVFAAAPESEAAPEPEAEQAGLDRAHRAELRAYYAAPPVIPHESESMQDSNCAFCHSAERELPNFDRVSPRSPHPHLERCSQCHMASHSPLGEAEKPVETSWLGLTEPGIGHRANALAPPVMPHGLRMRDNCISCHSPESPYEYLRCPHPERVNCQQCHVPDASLTMPLSVTQAFED